MFRKSSFSGADCCVEVGVGYVRSRASVGTGACVEVGADEAPGGEIVVRVRDSKQKDSDGNHIGPVLEFTKAEWDAFLEGMDAGPNCEFRVAQKETAGSGANSDG